MQRERPLLSLAALALLLSPLVIALYRPAGAVFVGSGCLKPRGTCVRRAVMDNGAGSSCSTPLLSSVSLTCVLICTAVALVGERPFASRALHVVYRFLGRKNLRAT